MEASEKGLLKDKIEWGDYKRAAEVAMDIALQRTELGRLLGKGVRAASMELGGPEATEFAMHVKGLEISAYDCHAAPDGARILHKPPHWRSS